MFIHFKYVYAFYGCDKSQPNERSLGVFARSLVLRIMHNFQHYQALVSAWKSPERNLNPMKFRLINHQSLSTISKHLTRLIGRKRKAIYRLGVVCAQFESGAGFPMSAVSTLAFPKKNSRHYHRKSFFLHETQMARGQVQRSAHGMMIAHFKIVFNGNDPQGSKIRK